MRSGCETCRVFAVHGTPTDCVLLGIGRLMLGSPPETSSDGSVEPLGQGTCVFRVDDVLSSFDTSYYDRAALPAGQPVRGPAILLQTDSTTVVPPDWSFEVDRFGNVIMTRKEK